MIKFILNILILPFWLIYSLVIKPIAFRMFKKDFQQKEDKIQDLYKEIRNLRQQKEDLEKELKIEKHKKERIKNFIQYWQNKKKEIFLSNKNELIFIFLEEESFSHKRFVLYGENGKGDNLCDAEIGLSMFNMSNTSKIIYFISNTKRQGYGRILLEYVINFARQDGIKKIIGDLSPVDEYEFEWLIPFYKSVGFESKSYDDKSKEKMAGEIFMNL